MILRKKKFYELPSIRVETKQRTTLNIELELDLL